MTDHEHEFEVWSDPDHEPYATTPPLVSVASDAVCSFRWTIRNHPRFDECSDEWCETHGAWRREEPPCEFCEAVTLAGLGETVERLMASTQPTPPAHEREQ